MRRLFSIAAFVLFVALAPAVAQMRGGGRAAGGGHGGFAGHVGGGRGFSGGHAFGGMQRAPNFGGRGFHNGPSFHRPFHRPGFSGRGFHHRGPRFRTFGFRNCFGCRRSWGWPWGYAGYYDPYWWWDSGSSYDEDREREIRLADEMNAQSLEEQRMLREQDREGDQDLYARSDPRPQPSVADPPDAAAPATVLIFRDQHKQEVQNYAIVGSTLWVFGTPRTQKISLADIDIPATAKANDERGVEFRVPGESQGQ